MAKCFTWGSAFLRFGAMLYLCSCILIVSEEEGPDPGLTAVRVAAPDLNGTLVILRSQVPVMDAEKRNVGESIGPKWRLRVPLVYRTSTGH